MQDPQNSEGKRVLTTAKKTPLYEIHEKLGAKIVEFGGWKMPVHYSGILEEHKAVRNKAGIFDTSHMGEVSISGKDALSLLQKLTTNNASKLEVGCSQYALMCHKDGGIVDDLYVCKTALEEYLLVINASNTKKDIEHIKRVGKKFPEAKIEDISETIAMLALQGPEAEKVIKKIYGENIPSKKNYFTKLGSGIMVSRTGYTGEDGFELFFSKDGQAKEAWESFLKEGVVPCGLGARDTLRLEMGYMLYGNELGRETTPLEVGLEWAVFFGKDFLGKDALVKQKAKGIEKKLIGFELVERGIARQHYRIKVIEKENYKVLLANHYEVTSGTMSPTLGKPIGMAYLPTRYSAEGIEFSIEIRDKLVKARVVKKPFLKKN